MRPNLTKDLSAEVFKDFYWLKEELQSFCRENRISPSGSKIEISGRVELFLRTGEIRQPGRKPIVSKKAEQQGILSLDTIITENHRCSQNVRAFFKTVIPKFHFSAYIQNYFKNNAGKTYRDAANTWYIEEKRKKDPAYKNSIAPQFEYNQFIRDFFADLNNQGKGRKEAIEAWNKIKQFPGGNKYMPAK